VGNWGGELQKERRLGKRKKEGGMGRERKGRSCNPFSSFPSLLLPLSCPFR
jgi:hypothetical protein